MFKVGLSNWWPSPIWSTGVKLYPPGSCLTVTPHAAPAITTARGSRLPAPLAAAFCPCQEAEHLQQCGSLRVRLGCSVQQGVKRSGDNHKWMVYQWCVCTDIQWRRHGCNGGGRSQAHSAVVEGRYRHAVHQ